MIIFMLAPDYFETMGPIVAAENGISLELATKYLVLIGDTPEFDPRDPGKVVVCDDNDREIGRIKWPPAPSPAR